jgi:hypothetical protein
MIQNRRTGILDETRTFIFLKLLLKLLRSPDIQAKVTTMAEQHLSLRDDTVDDDRDRDEEQSVVDLAQEDDDEVSAFSDDQQCSSAAGDSKDLEQATGSSSAAPLQTGNSNSNPPGKKKNANSASKSKALKSLASFGDFKFQSPAVSTRSGGLSNGSQSNSAGEKGGSSKGAGSKKATAKVAKAGKNPPAGSKLKQPVVGQQKGHQKGKACSSNESIESFVPPAKKKNSGRSRNVAQQETPSPLFHSPPVFDHEGFQQSVSDAAAAAVAAATRKVSAELKRDHEMVLQNMQEEIHRLQQQEAVNNPQSLPSTSIKFNSYFFDLIKNSNLFY